jgi:hypothetical protein
VLETRRDEKTHLGSLSDPLRVKLRIIPLHSPQRRILRWEWRPEVHWLTGGVGHGSAHLTALQVLLWGLMLLILLRRWLVRLLLLLLIWLLRGRLIVLPLRRRGRTVRRLLRRRSTIWRLGRRCVALWWLLRHTVGLIHAVSLGRGLIAVPSATAAAAGRSCPALLLLLIWRLLLTPHVQ